MNEIVMDTREIEIRVEEDVVSVLPWSSGFGFECTRKVGAATRRSLGC
jgi:hypothetical protein